MQEQKLNSNSNQKIQKRAAVLWTGGKDSALSMHLAQSMGYQICCLATFVPSEAKFLAHPIDFIRNQSISALMPLHLIEIREPFRQGYENAIRTLKNNLGIEALITGDIAEVDGQANWIRQCSESLNIDVQTPLWNWDRLTLLQRLIQEKFKVIFSCVKSPWLCEKWIGKEIDHAAVEDLQKVRSATGLDLCGEQGEYHTLVTDAPFFKKKIQIKSYSKKQKDSMSYIAIEQLEMTPKA
jgi:diphthine-ammonia ligase